MLLSTRMVLMEVSALTVNMVSDWLMIKSVPYVLAVDSPTLVPNGSTAQELNALVVAVMILLVALLTQPFFLLFPSLY